MPITAAEPFSAFLAGRQTRQQEEYGNTRNALARMEAEQMPTEIANRNRMADMQAQQYSQEQVTRALQQTAAGAMRIAQSQNPQAEAAAAYPEFAAKLREQNPDWDRLSPEEARQYAGWIAGQAQSKLGIAPTARLETIQSEGGGILQRDPTTGALKQVVAPQKPDHFAETQAAADRRALEQRTHAERMAEEQRKFTSEENALNRQAKTDLKSETANVKERVIAKQNQRAYDVYSTGVKGLLKGLAGANTGPIAGRMPALTANQQIAEGSVAAMAPVLKQLFRGAGEGTFTDKDQELLMEMLPTRKDEPEARAAKIANIDAIVRAKLGMPAQQSAPPEAIEHLRNNPQLKGAFQEKYGYLPDGI